MYVRLIGSYLTDDCKPSESIPSTDLTKQESDDSNKNSSALKDVLQTGSNSSGSKTLSEDKKPLTGSVFGSPAGSATTATFSFGSFASSAASSQSTSSSFCFGSPTSTNTSNPTPATFSFGSGNSTSPSAGFSFGGTGKPFTFSNVANTNSTEEKKDDNEDADEDTPPKPDHKPVNEDGATYTKRYEENSLNLVFLTVCLKFDTPFSFTFQMQGLFQTG